MLEVKINELFHCSNWTKVVGSTQARSLEEMSLRNREDSVLEVCYIGGSPNH